MASISYIQKSRKPFICQKCRKEIPAGSPYWRGKRNFAAAVVRCTSCGLRVYELSGSEYIQATGRLKDKWQEDYGTADGVWEQIAEELESIRDEQQEHLDNMPDSLQFGGTGELLQERIDGLDAAIDSLNEVDYADILTDAIEEDLDLDDQDALEKLKATRFEDKDYDEWLEGFLELAMEAHPNAEQKWAKEYMSLAVTLFESIEQRIIDLVEDALENIE